MILKKISYNNCSNRGFDHQRRMASKNNLADHTNLTKVISNLRSYLTFRIL